MGWQDYEIEEVKQLPPEVVLNDLSIPYKEYPSQIMATAVWRNERTPSVSIRQVNGVWLWKDFGSNEGGSWIDLYMKVLGWDFTQTVKYLREKFLGDYKEIKPLVEKWKRKEREKERFSSGSYSVLSSRIRKVSYPLLLEYLKQRGVEKIPEWLKEVSFKVSNGKRIKKFWGVGVQTTSGSWVIRNPKMKINLRTKPNQEHSFSLIKRGENNEKVVVVEGLFDALSVEQLSEKKDYDILILNSVSMVNKVISSEVFDSYKTVVLCLDNDNAGRQKRNFLNI